MAELAPQKDSNVRMPEEAEVKVVSPWKEAWKGFKKNRLALVGTGIVAFFILLAIFADVIAPYRFDGSELTATISTPV